MLAGELWHPAERQGPGLLLVYSHSFLSFHQEDLYLARFLAPDGALTAIMATFQLSMRDPRIAAVNSIAGPTSLAAYTFLENALARDAAVRDAAHRYLIEALPTENSREENYDFDLSGYWPIIQRGIFARHQFKTHGMGRE